LIFIYKHTTKCNNLGAVKNISRERIVELSLLSLSRASKHFAMLDGAKLYTIEKEIVILCDHTYPRNMRHWKRRLSSINISNKKMINFGNFQFFLQKFLKAIIEMLTMVVRYCFLQKYRCSACNCLVVYNLCRMWRRTGTMISFHVQLE